MNFCGAPVEAAKLTTAWIQPSGESGPACVPWASAA